MWEHVDDLRLQVFEMRYLPMEVRERFRSTGSYEEAKRLLQR